MIVVTLLLFLSISIAIRFSSRFFVSINNLISASNNIGNGNLNSKVPEIKTDKELEKLNKNFNLMIDRLKTQQNKLLANERHDAWENVARKIAHEIKNPLTPIQLIIDSLKNKYTDLLDENNKISFNWRIIMAPDPIIDYLIVHELSHIIEPNHSKNFWYHVGNYCEDFQKKRKWLRKNGHKLVL